MLIIIDHNKETQLKPYHTNKDLMTCALQMEIEERANGLVGTDR